MLWISLVLLYGLLKGSREIAKKKALNKNSVMEVLFSYTLISFILVLPKAKEASGMEARFYFYIAFKSFCIFIAWICSFKSIKKLPVSIYGILDLSRVLFATFLGVTVLGEVLSLNQIAGLIIVSGGLLLLRYKPSFLKRVFKVQKDFEVSDTQNELTCSTGFNVTLYVVLALSSCVLNAVSGLLDKILMKDLSSAQLQFWYMLFLVLYYLIFILMTEKKITLDVFKNKWMYLMAVMFVIGDKALFIANGIEDSRITIMTLIKQSGCIITIAGGKLFFKEKNIAYRLFCACVIISGIITGVM